ncbi:MAG: methyltransferase domain-containing protein [Betaproteobacteria bacterium]|nr:MAG: methyltransferase domain-containing protein [Betaproteobacteria bacterium]
MSLLSNAEAFKRAALTQWEQAAPGWNDHAPQIRAWLQPATDAMLTMAGVRPGARVLDVAAGSGDQTLDIAQRVGPEGAVVATDFSPALLAFAKANAARAGCANVQTMVADAEALDLPEASFDATVCRLGLMLLPDPLHALRAMQRALRPCGGACAMVFSVPQANPCVAILMATALEHAGQQPRDPFQPGGLFSLGKPGALDELFRAARFRDVATTKLQAPFRLPSARAYLDFVRSSASPIQQILAGLDPTRRQAAWTVMEERLRKFDTAAGWEGPNELLLTAARRPN